MFCCFVDYRKAFDKIDRNVMISKLSKSGVDFQILNIITLLYTNIIGKMCIPVVVRYAALFLIMYGDDTMLFSETEQAL